MVSNKIRLISQGVEVTPVGVNKLLGFRGKFTLPYSRIRRVSLDYGLLNGGGGWRMAGTGLPGKHVGLFDKNGVKAYVNLTKNEVPLLVEVKDGTIKQYILGVENPEGLLQEIEQAQPDIQVDKPDKTPIIQEQTAMSRAASFLLTTIIYLVIIMLIIQLLGSLLQVVSPVAMKLTEPLTSALAIVLVALVILTLILTLISNQAQRKHQHS